MIAEAAPIIVHANHPSTAAPWIRTVIALAAPTAITIGGAIFAWKESRK